MQVVRKQYVEGSARFKDIVREFTPQKVSARDKNKTFSSVCLCFYLNADADAIRTFRYDECLAACF